jgi:hypothetical protein
MRIINRTYLLRGVPVVVLAKWRHVPIPKDVKGPPRNILFHGTSCVKSHLELKLSE